MCIEGPRVDAFMQGQRPKLGVRCKLFAVSISKYPADVQDAAPKTVGLSCVGLLNERRLMQLGDTLQLCLVLPGGLPKSEQQGVQEQVLLGLKGIARRRIILPLHHIQSLARSLLLQLSPPL